MRLYGSFLLTTRTQSHSYVERLDAEVVLVVTTSGTRRLDWPLAGVSRPRKRGRRTPKRSKDCCCSQARRT